MPCCSSIHQVVWFADIFVGIFFDTAERNFLLQNVAWVCLTYRRTESADRSTQPCMITCFHFSLMGRVAIVILWSYSSPYYSDLFFNPSSFLDLQVLILHYYNWGWKCTDRSALTGYSKFMSKRVINSESFLDDGSLKCKKHTVRDSIYFP